MASRSSVIRAARLFTSVAAKRPSPFACQQWTQTAQMPRLFTVSAQLKEKKYTEDHEWIEASADGKTYTLGISEYAAKALGDVVYIELPQVDLEVGEGDAIGAVESVKSASDILTPVSGTVSEVNEALESKPGNINKDPEGEAWIAKITVSEEPAGKLMSEAEYKEFTEEA
ncbi:glycine cleavage system H-protein subunit [Didymella glomerata]|uniref:Glycine cleavage system H protein n=1 Tax=Didymella glomerata TaxID=749621 RepID=A0A9W8WTV5_9PLEO|nr:glycine cleavage system H-protein subunit [Didymella glomerata]